MGRYSNIKKTTTPSGNIIYRTTKYPEIKRSDDDIYAITQTGDRYDILANQYYKDPTLWWVISNANYGTEQNSYYPPIGFQIRIPSNVDGVLRNFQKINE